MSTNPAERAILNRIDDVKRIPVLGIRQSDGYIIIAGALIGLFLQSLIGIPALFWPTVGGCVFISAFVVFASPDHVPTTRWVQDIYAYWKRPNVYFAASDGADNEHNRGGLLNRAPFTEMVGFEPDTTTQDLTNIERAWPGAGAVLRTDGRVEAMVEIDADNMDFATAGDWAARQQVAKEFANKSLDGDLKLHLTTESFNIDHVVDRLEQRVQDPDIQSSPTKQGLLKEYKQRRPEEMRDRGTQTVRAFLSISVKESDVTDSQYDEPTPLEKAAYLPVVGPLVSLFVDTSADLPDSELYDAMLDELDRRIHDEVMTELVQKTPGFSGRRLSTLELFTLSSRFWNSNDEAYEELDDVVSSHAVMRRSARENGGGHE